MQAVIDARGKACPTPVLMARKALEEHGMCTILVDNQTAVENLKRLGDSRGCPVQVNPAEEGFLVQFSAGNVENAAAPGGGGEYAIFVGRDVIGAGDRELGTNLMRMFFYTLAQSDSLPAAILFMNDGVKLPTLDDQVVEHLGALTARGVEVLVCGACLNFYHLEGGLRAGAVSNMYDILTRMQQAGKVISL